MHAYLGSISRHNQPLHFIDSQPMSSSWSIIFFKHDLTGPQLKWSGAFGSPSLKKYPYPCKNRVIAKRRPDDERPCPLTHPCPQQTVKWSFGHGYIARKRIYSKRRIRNWSRRQRQSGCSRSLERAPSKVN